MAVRCRDAAKPDEPVTFPRVRASCCLMNKSLRVALVLLLFTMLLTVGGAAFWLYQAPHRTVGRIHLALRQSDTNTLARDIDFPALQQSLLGQVTTIVTNKMAQDAPDGQVNPVARALADGVVKHLVKQHVTPAGLAKLLSGQKPSAKPESKADAVAGRAPSTAELDQAFGSSLQEYRGLDQFVVYLTGRHGEVTELILLRSGLRWRWSAIVLPTGG